MFPVILRPLGCVRELVYIKLKGYCIISSVDAHTHTCTHTHTHAHTRTCTHTHKHKQRVDCMWLTTCIAKHTQWVSNSEVDMHTCSDKANTLIFYM